MNNKNKIGLITFHNSHNCGSMLQTYALQQVLIDKFNCDVEIIDFSNKAQKNMYAPIPKPRNYKQVIKAIIWMTNYKQLKKQFEGYQRFKEKYFNLSSKSYETLKELKNDNLIYNKLITGSDQVWNIKCTDADKAYFLDFHDKAKKYAYAVSFGANNVFESNEEDYYKKMITNMKYVSVRENNAKKWIKKSMNIDVPICLDPTMLLNQKEWESYINIGNSPLIKGKYIFYYCFGISQEIAKFLKRLSAKANLPVYFFEAKEWTLKCCWKNNIKLAKQYGPESFLNIVKYADVLITTSFHGTAFSTIFKKDFWYINDGHNDPNRDDRAISFLTQLNLMSRYLTMDKLIDQDLHESPNYEDVERQLVKLQEKSFEFLRNIVED